MSTLFEGNLLFPFSHFSAAQSVKSNVPNMSDGHITTKKSENTSQF